MPRSSNMKCSSMSDVEQASQPSIAARCSSNGGGGKEGLSEIPTDGRYRRTGSRRGTRASRSLLASSPLLLTLAVALLAMSAVPSIQASLSCATDADCSVKGVGKCKQRTNGEAWCVYKFCAAGFYGAGSTYTDCYECPSGMTSLAGKAFYATDCFLPCGEERCYVPGEGYAECAIESATAQQVCLQSCDTEGYVVLNPTKPFATCVPESSMTNSTLTDQSQKVVMKKSNGRIKRYFKRAGGRRLKADVDLRRQGPAAALLKNAGKDPLQLVSK